MADARQTQELTRSSGAVAHVRLRVFDDNGYKVTAEIDARRVGPLPFEFSSDEHVRRTLKLIAEAGGQLDDLRELGTLLWEALFPGIIHDEISKAISVASETLRIELSLPPRLEDLPWETLYDGKTREFLACHPRVALVHRRDPPRESPSTTRSARRPVAAATMLVVIPEGSGLNVEQEWVSIRSATGRLGGAVSLHSLRGRVTADRLSEELEKQSWDIVHFVGHGRVAHRLVEIRINGDDGAERWISADVFGDMFTSTEIGLCVLNCCYGASASGIDGMDRLAPTLLDKGVRFVVAMRYSIADQDALRFANSFYQSLLRGDARGCPEIATQQARRALRRNASTDLMRSFVTPVFFSGDTDPVLLELIAEPEASRSGHVVSSGARDPIPLELRRAIESRKCVPILGDQIGDTNVRREGPVPIGASRLLDHVLAALQEPPPGLSEIVASNNLPPFVVLAQVAEHVMAETSFVMLADHIGSYCAKLRPHPIHHTIASWLAPAVIYTHIDGLMERVMNTGNERCTIIEGVQNDLEGDERALILARGTVSNPHSLVLTEHDHDKLEDRMYRLPWKIAGLIRNHFGRRALFLGVHPRDPVIRLLARRLLESDERAPKSYLVAPDATSVDDIYWAKYRVEIIRESTDEFIAAWNRGSGS